MKRYTRVLACSENVVNLAGNMAEGAPVIPISALKNQNMDLVCEYIASIPVPVRDYTSDPRMFGNHI